MKNITASLLLIAIICITSSCHKDDESTPSYSIPTTYNFENVNYSGQEQRIAMLAEFKAYMKSANTANTVLDVNRLKAMYANDSAVAQFQGNYEDSKQMKNKTFEGAQSIFESLLDDLAAASTSTVAGMNGQAGVVNSLDGAKIYLLNANGVENGQLIEKGLMGALLYYQSTAVYMESGKIDSDNETVTTDRGTEMEHAWDEAFGYFGVPKTFPSDTEPLYFWGDYCNDRNALLDSNQKVMDAFLKGRAAISNKDIASRDEAIIECRTAWEEVIVGTALHYLNGSIEDFGDLALRTHQLSEAVGFIYSLQFNPAKRITNAQADELIHLIGGQSDLTQLNFYNSSIDDIMSARNTLADYYNFNDLKDQF